MYVKQQYDYCEVCIMYMYSMYVNSNMTTVGYYAHVQYVC